MGYYDRFPSEAIKTLKELNDKLVKEEAQKTPDNAELLKLRQQILMKGLEMSVGFNIDNYNPYR